MSFRFIQLAMFAYRVFLFHLQDVANKVKVCLLNKKMILLSNKLAGHVLGK